MNSLKRDLLCAMHGARAQADSFLHRDTPEGLRYEGEARGLAMAIRMVAEDDRKRWAAERRLAMHEEKTR